VYATGKSEGGGFVGGILACNETASKRFAAFAPVAGAFYEGYACNPGYELVPMLEFHGDDDSKANYTGGNNTRDNGSFPPIEQWLADWATRDGCENGTEPKLTTIKNGEVQVRKWTCDDAKDIVTGYKIHGLRHQWPATHPNADNSGVAPIDATPIIMDFFNQHKRSQ
jgi:polyhydroxybutyrate depolymerase